MAQVAHVVEAGLAGQRPGHNLEFGHFAAAEFRRQRAQLLFLRRSLCLREIQLVAQLFTGEACAIDIHRNSVDLIGLHLEELLIIYRVLYQCIHHLHGTGSLYGVHLPLLRDVLILHFIGPLMGVEPGEHHHLEQRGDPELLVLHAEDHDIVDDLGILVQHGGVTLAAVFQVTDVLGEDVVEERCGVLAGHFHQLVGPEVPTHCIADGHMLAALHIVKFINVFIYDRVRDLSHFSLLLFPLSVE